MAFYRGKIKSPVLVPFWIRLTLDKLGLPILEALNPQTVSKHFSIEDAAHMFALNVQYTKQVFGIDYPIETLRQHWAQDEQFLQRIEAVLPTHAPTLVDRLFTPEAKLTLFPKAFAIDDPCREYTFATIYPGYFGDAQTPNHQNLLLDAILRLAYANSTYDEVSKDELYGQYFKRLFSQGT